MAEEESGDGHRRDRRRRRRRRPSADTVLITSAKRSRLADWRHRRHLYAALQLSRIPLFVAAVGIYGWLHNPLLAAFVAVISLPLPWIAVLLANEGGESREAGAPKVYKPALVREQRARELQALQAETHRRQALGNGAQNAPDTPSAPPYIIDADDDTDPQENNHR